MLRFIIILLSLAGAYFGFLADPREEKWPPGVMVASAPYIGVVGGAGSWQKGSYTVTPLAAYSVRARVLSKAHYFLGRETDLSAYDLALGWKDMSDSAVLARLEISQDDRWYHYQWRGDLPIPREDIPEEAGNMHIIAGTKDVEKILPKIARGNIIALEGYLIRLDAADGWHWASSVTTNSEGPHACKLIWVTKLAIEK